MKAVILAAGIASRLRPLTENTPKCLLEIGNKNILQRTIENLLDNGIKEYIIVTGFLENKIKDFIKQNFPDIKVEYIFNDKFESTNNIYSLWMVKDKVIGNDILLLDSDILFDSNIIGLLLKSEFDNCLALRSKGGEGDEEIKVKLSDSNSITEISKTINIDEAIGESIGIEKFSKTFIDKLFTILDTMIIKENKVDIFYEAAFQQAINNGNKIFPVDVGDLYCIELDTFEDIESAKLSFSRQLI